MVDAPHGPRTVAAVLRISARDNPRVQRAKRIACDAALARRQGVVWAEGDHLARAALAQGWSIEQLLMTEDALSDARFADVLAAADEVVVLPAKLMAAIVALDSPPALAVVLRHRAAPADIDADAPTVVLDRVQDPGNVGSILRSASAFGFRQVIALPGTAALWSAKVLRAGMGAQFALHLFEHADDAMLDALGTPWLGTSSHATERLGDTPLPSPCTWVIGHEGQGMSPALAVRCGRVLRIAQPGGEESLNAAVAAAICLYESARNGPRC